MKKLLITIVFVLLVAGCQSNDLRATIVAENQPAPHDGYNIGPDIWVEQGDPVKIAGAVVWIKGLDPNSVQEWATNSE